jgi:outer membrane protein OmpA-like peptidoglycan-associated protein
LFQLKTTPQLQLVQQYKTVNSKLKSDNITIIFQDKTNRLWVGTDGGLMFGVPGRWKSEFASYNIQRIREYGTVTYVLADGEISKAPNGDKWSDLALDKKNLEGQIADFDIDATGKMWIVSGIVTRFDLLDATYTTFSGPEYYTSQYGSNMAIDSDGAVWIGTEDKGLYIVDKASSMTVNFLIEQPISCTGNGKDAVLRLKITGGLAPYKIEWTGGLTGENPHNVPSGNYTATVTDAKGKARTVQVPVPDARLRITARQRKALSGPGKSDAVGEVDIEGNASGLQITWDNGETLATATKLSAGEHTVTVTDPKGCTVTAKVTITEKVDPLSIKITETETIKCAGDKTAAVAVQVSGGKAPFQYKWNNTALSGENAAGLAAGGYQVTVTDAAGTTAFAAVVIPQPEPFAVIALAQSSATPGATDGKAQAQTTGGVVAKGFLWDNGETTAVATKLPAGQHTVTATNPNGCTATATVRIMENIQPLTILISEKTSIKCFGEKAALGVVVSGGKAPFQYKWSSAALSNDQPVGVAAGDYQLTVTDVNGVTSVSAISVKQPEKLTLKATVEAPASTGNRDGKALAQPTGGAGNYIFQWQSGESGNAAVRLAPGANGVTVTDANGCTATASVSVSENIQPLSVSISEKTKIKCAGDKTAALSVDVSGGKPPFDYQWNNPTLNGGQLTGLPNGDYAVTVTDAAGNSSTAKISVVQPQPLLISASVQGPASTGNTDGKAQAQVTGGSGAQSFKWDNGESTAAAVQLAPGQHSVIVTDANGCVATTTVNIFENVQPLTVKITEKTGIKCAGDKTAALAVQITGGKGPFKYLWSNAAMTGDQPAEVGAGTYSVTVADGTGKTTTATATVLQPQPIVLTATVQSPASTGNSDGKAQAEVAGGSGALTYKWDNGETTVMAVKLAPGQHSVTVTDANGCYNSVSIQISENVQPLTVSISEKTKINCAGEKSTLNVQVSGGKAPFTFAWSNSALSGAQPTGVDGGSYQLTVTDAKGTSQTASVEVKSPEALEVTLVRNIGATTDRSNDGKAEITVKGGTPKYSIAWDTKQTGLSAPKLPLGKHSVVVTDANGCTRKIDFETEKRILPELTGNLESGQTIRMRLLNFDTDSASLKQESLPMLDELYDFMSQNGAVVIEVGGHTNNVPPDEFADRLSTARAKTVADYLFAKGIDPKRVVFKGYGKRQPLVPNTSPEGRKTNQRVEIKILRLKD